MTGETGDQVSFQHVDRFNCNQIESQSLQNGSQQDIYSTFGTEL